jgi:hypothetical protein
MISFFALLSILAGAAEFKLNKDKQNVVSSRLAGSWKMNKELTIKLYGNDKVVGENAMSEVSFEVDDEVFNLFLKAKLADQMTEEQKAKMPAFYQAGWMRFAKQKCPYFLTEMSGNPVIIFFLKRDGDIFGNGESFNVMLAVAKDTKNDALFIGGDFNNQPFRAYSRVQ